MNPIITKTYELIDELDKSDIIKNISIYKEKILSNQELQNLINIGNNTNDEYKIKDIKNKLYQYEDYKKYMDNYNELMYIVMDFNYNMKKLINTKNCIR